MARSKKIPKAVRIYAIVTQYVIFLVFITYLSYFLGDKLDKYLGYEVVFYSAIFGVLAIVLGISLLVYNILRFKK